MGETDARRRVLERSDVHHFETGVRQRGHAHHVTVQTEGRPTAGCATGAAEYRWRFAVAEDDPDRAVVWPRFDVDAHSGVVTVVDATRPPMEPPVAPSR